MTEMDADEELEFSRQISITSESSEHWPRSEIDDAVSLENAARRGYKFSMGAVMNSCPQQVPPKVEPPKDIFNRTKLCRYHVASMCFKGLLCRFAHSPEEIRPLPYLFGTQSCPLSSSGGSCRANRDYAYSVDQLRNFRHTGKRQLQQEQQWGQRQHKPEHRSRQDEKLSGKEEHPMANWQQQEQVQQPHEAMIIQLDQYLGMLSAPDRIKEVGLEIADIGATPEASLDISPQTTQACAVPTPEEISSSSMVNPDVAPAAQLSMSVEGVQAHATVTEVCSESVKQKSRKILRSTRNMFHKTKLCRHFALGHCEKGSSCSFAHAVEELNACPDLIRSKMCPVLTQIGTCSNKKCTFAHHEHELRKANRRQGGAVRHAVDLLKDPGFQIPSVMEDHEYSPTPVMFKDEMLVVKNTFLDVQEPSPYLARLRSHSVPSLKSRSLLTRDVSE